MYIVIYAKVLAKKSVHLIAVRLSYKKGKNKKAK